MIVQCSSDVGIFVFALFVRGTTLYIFLSTLFFGGYSHHSYKVNYHVYCFM